MKQFNYSKIEFENVECLFCKGKTEKEFLFEVPDRINNLPGMFSLVKCRRCGLVFQDPRPREEYIKNYYPDNANYYKPSKQKQYNFGMKIERKILSNFYNYGNLGSSNYFSKILYFLLYFYFYRHRSIPKYAPDGKLLEIGCSNGEKLERFKKWGWNVTGIELNRNAATFGIEKRKLDIKIGSIFNYEFPFDSFDVIIMDMVLEHLYYPGEAISKITKWLKPGGQLIFSIPYFEGIEFKLFGKYAYGIQLPCHIYFFNKKHIKRLLDNNYQNIKIIFHHFDRDIVASCYHKYQFTGKYFFKFVAYNKIIRYLLIKPLVFLLSLLKRTSRITVFAEKNN